jgi:ERCC4-type nuclease
MPFISPTEPKELHKLGTVSWKPELHGVDIMFASKGRWIGIQRKEVKDFVASIENKLLNKQLSQMGNLDIPILLIEGQFKFTVEGVLAGKDYGRSWTDQSIWGLMLSIQAKGVQIVHTQNLAATARFIKYSQTYFAKSRHSSLSSRDGVFSVWGTKPTDKEYGVYVLQSLPGVGPELAERIWDIYGLPMQLTIGMEELLKVDGIGKKKAENIVAALGKR